MRILVIDVGGHNVKLRHPGQRTVVKIPSGPAAHGRLAWCAR